MIASPSPSILPSGDNLADDFVSILKVFHWCKPLWRRRRPRHGGRTVEKQAEARYFREAASSPRPSEAKP